MGPKWAGPRPRSAGIPSGTGAEDPEDYGLLDGLVRAVFDAARTAGVTYYDIPDEAAGEYRRAFEVYDYALAQAEELERFFARHNCKGQSSGF